MFPDDRVYVETWTLAVQDPAASDVVVAIHYLSQRNRYAADIRRGGELIETVADASLESIRKTIQARVGGLVRQPNP